LSESEPALERRIAPSAADRSHEAIDRRKEAEMIGRRRFKRCFVVGLALAALGASVAQAEPRPEYRTGTASPVARPDDRPGLLGVGTQQRTAATDVISRYLKSHRAAVRRVGPHPAGIVATAVEQSGSSWSTAQLATVSALAAIAAALAFALMRRRRSQAAALQG
jgi:hypothetical protein